jgi:hypothetical protein
MKKIKKLMYVVSGTVFIMCAHAQQKDPNEYAFMTTRDMQNLDLSKITITNDTSQTIAASGLFIASYDVNECSSCTGSVAAGDNAGGAIASPVTFKPHQTIAIGANYLYNMIYNGLYYVSTIITPLCALPGCSWPGDDINVHAWCITINATSIHTNYTYSNYTNGANPPANFPAYGAAGNSTPFNYKYDLIDPFTLGDSSACLGPITCNDKTLTCSVATSQNENLQAYS